MTGLVISDVLLVAGSAVSLLAAIGLVRMPDVFTRIQAAAKGGTLGVGLLALAAATAFGDLATWTKSVLLIAFLAFTAPVAAHLIARAAHRLGIQPWTRDVETDGTCDNSHGSEPTWSG